MIILLLLMLSFEKNMKMQSEQIEELIRRTRFMLTYGASDKEIIDTLPIQSTHDVFLIITAAKILNSK
jgi:hypothetical protein